MTNHSEDSNRKQIFDIIVKQSIAGAPWKEICARPMQVHNISLLGGLYRDSSLAAVLVNVWWANLILVPDEINTQRLLM